MKKLTMEEVLQEMKRVTAEREAYDRSVTLHTACLRATCKFVGLHHLTPCLSDPDWQRVICPKCGFTWKHKSIKE